MTKLKINQVASTVWNVEEYNDDLEKEETVWIDLKGTHCTCSKRAFMGSSCIHIKEVEKHYGRFDKRTRDSNKRVANGQ